jgi:Flp pilus assembly protein TadG
MMLIRACTDERGTTAIEFGLTAPAFFLIVFGIIECGLLLWTQIGLLHGAEMAPRCASINKTVCGNDSATQNYAAQQAFGLNPSPSVYTVATAACGIRVSADYQFYFFTSYFDGPKLPLSAQSCFPT